MIGQAAETATDNVRFEVGDVFALRGAYDVVHAHQVLQHLADPVGALAAMRGLTRPGGLVAVRDADYEAFSWYPADPRLDRWLALYREVARRNHGEPDAGRYLIAWAHAAGFTEVRASASAWCFADPEDRAWWSDTWAARISDSTLSARAIELGLADQPELDDLAEGWRAVGRRRRRLVRRPPRRDPRDRMISEGPGYRIPVAPSFRISSGGPGSAS